MGPEAKGTLRLGGGRGDLPQTQEGSGRTHPARSTGPGELLRVEWDARVQR